MAHILAQVRLRRTTNLPEDLVINTFHFRTPDALVTAGDKANIASRLEFFYNGTPSGGGNPIRVRLSNLLATTAHSIRLYDMAAAIPRAPIHEGLFDFSGPLGSGSQYPAEVALCISFRGPLLSGTAARRRRGRVYIGPLNPSVALDAGDMKPAQSMLQDFVNAAADLRDGAGTPKWAVFSEVGNALTDVTHVWCDNAFDTQRRRGAKANLRISNPV